MQWSYFRFVKDKAVDGLVVRHSNTVKCELQLRLANHFADWHFQPLGATIDKLSGDKYIDGLKKI